MCFTFVMYIYIYKNCKLININFSLYELPVHTLIFIEAFIVHVLRPSDRSINLKYRSHVYLQPI